MNKNIDWLTKLKLALAFEPTLSASSVSEGDNIGRQRIWAGAGIVLAQGIIVAADAGDSNSRATSLNDRQTPKKKKLDIDSVLSQQRSGLGYVNQDNGYNELVIRSPRAAGIYYCCDFRGGMEPKDSPPPEVAIAAAHEFDIPLFLMLEGRLYQIPGLTHESLADLIKLPEIEGQTRRLERLLELGGYEISKDDIVNSKWQMPESTRELIRTNLVNSEVFNLSFLADRVPDIKMYESRAQGMIAYLESIASKNIGQTELALKVQNNNTNYQDDIEPLTRIRSVNTIRTYFVRAGQLWLRTDHQASKSSSTRIVNTSSLSESRVMLSIPLLLEASVNNVEEFVAAMKELVKHCSTQDEVLLQLGFYLHGFAELASQFGDNTTHQLVKELAATVIPPEDYQEFVQRRIKNTGEFKLTLEDLM